MLAELSRRDQSLGGAAWQAAGLIVLAGVAGVSIASGFGVAAVVLSLGFAAVALSQGSLGRFLGFASLLLLLPNREVGVVSLQNLLVVLEGGLALGFFLYGQRRLDPWLLWTGLVFILLTAVAGTRAYAAGAAGSSVALAVAAVGAQVAMVALGASRQYSEPEFRRLTGLLRVTAAFLGTWAIWEYVTGDPILLTFVSDVRRAVGPIGNPNYFGILLAVLAVAAFGSASAYKRRRLSLVPGILATVGVLATLSRGAILGEAFALAYVWTRRLTSSKRHMILVGLLAMLAVIGPFIVAELGASRRSVVGPEVIEMSASGDAASLRARLGAARLAVAYAIEHPWTGIGLHRFPTLARADARLGIFMNTHNEPLRIAAESGLLAVVALAAFSWRVVSRLRSRGTWVGSCVLACCICYLTAGLLSNGLESTVITLPLVALLTLAVGWERAPNRPEGSSLPESL